MERAETIAIFCLRQRHATYSFDRQMLGEWKHHDNPLECPQSETLLNPTAKYSDEPNGTQG